MKIKSLDKAISGGLATMFVAGLFSPSLAETDQELIQRFGFTTYLCTTVSVSDEKRAKACEEREGIWDELFELGYTYGCEGDSDDERYWRKDCG
jgi:hypothetical protein